MNFKADELKSIRVDLKKVMKGRPLYFGLMAPGSKRGKFRLSKKKGDTKPPTLKSEYNPYEDEKDNKLKGSACQGVVTAEKGVLKLHIDGKAPGAAIKFLNYLILREIKYKVVKDIVVAENVSELPGVPEEDPDVAPLSVDELRQRLADLLGQVMDVEESARPPILTPARAAKNLIGLGENATSEQLAEAEDLLDEAFALLAEVGGHGTSDGEQETGAQVDVAELERHLAHAKEMASLLPPGRVTDLAAQITLGRKQLDEAQLAPSKLEAAEETILGLEDEIDGAFQDFFLDQLKGIEPHLKTFPPNVLEAFNTCRKSIRKRNWPQAGNEWEALKKSIAEWRNGQTSSGSESSVPPAPAPPPPGATEPGGPMLAFTSRREELEPRLLEAQKADREQATRLGGVWGYAGEQAEAGAFDKAHGALDRLEKFIDDILKSASVDSPQLGIEKGIVEKRKFLLTRFREIPLEIEPHLQTVRMKIEDSAVDDDPYELVAAIEAGLQNLYDELQDEIDNAINAGDSSVIAGLKSRVRGNELVKHLLENEFVDGSKFQSAILDALDEVEKKLVS